MPRTFLVPLILLLFATGMAHGRTEDNRNAATWYQKATQRLEGLFTPEESQAIADYASDPGAAPTAELRALLAKADSVLSAAQRASQQEYADYQLDYSQGFELLLPHLGPMRSVAKLMQADAMVKLHDGNAAGAANRLAEMYRMSGHFTDDRILLSSLVGQAVFSLTDAGAQSALDHAALGPEESAALLAAVQTLGTDDPFGYAEGIAMEQEVAVATMEKLLADDEGRLKLAEWFPNPDQQQELLNLDEESGRESIEQYDHLMDQVGEVFAIKDPDLARAEMTRLQQEIAEGEHGVVAKVLTPAFGKVLENKFKSEQAIADRIEVLSKLAAGEAKPQETANAAVWYLKAIEMWESLDAAKREALHAGSADPRALMPEGLRAMVTAKDAQDVLDVMREASLMKRCDFKAVTPNPDTHALVPPHLPGMHDLFRLALTDALRLLADENADHAADRLSIAYRAVGHLEGDPRILSSLAAHVNFTRTFKITAAAFTDQSLGDAHRATLLNALERISRKDPFGYLASTAAAREELTRRFQHTNPRDEDHQHRLQQSVDVVKTWTADQLVCIAIILDTMTRAGQPADAPPAADPDAELKRLDDVLPLEAVSAVRRETSQLAPLLAQDDWDVFTGHAMPSLGEVMQRMRFARSDLRRAFMLLKPDDDRQPDG